MLVTVVVNADYYHHHFPPQTNLTWWTDDTIAELKMTLSLNYKKAKKFLMASYNKPSRVFMGAFDKLLCRPAVLTQVSPWQELIERSFTLSWWRHAPRASPTWPVPQAGYWGLTRVSAWHDVKAIRMNQGQNGVNPGKLIERNL